MMMRIESTLDKYKFYPDAEDITRGGLGMQVKARGFQWSHILATDVIFWYYEITNMGTYDYDKTLFAQYVDWGIGGANDNNGDYNELLDISYAWSLQPLGSPGNWSPVGLAGYAFLESPGISDDNRDNDIDGLTDERRDNEANLFIDNPESDPFINNASIDTAKFRQFYGYSWQPHWDADENANWRSYFDLNENGIYDNGEPLFDDVGTDGISSFDPGYDGPDIDGTEGNGKPDQGEPNFGILDKDESDQLGLTGFLIYPVHTYELRNDEQNWEVLSSLPVPVGQPLIGVNLANSFSSYLFHMNGRNTYSQQTGEIQETGETERFSMALIFALNENDLFRRKRTVQKIYNAHYHFAKPPDKPIIKVIPGDKKVTLIWDDRAEKTFDPFYQRYNFEGYKIYRSTESNFLENKIITDAYGKPTYINPIAQFDLIDGVKGLHPLDVNGALFYLGDDSGIKHSFVDTDVQNGQTYYYAVVAYDKGYQSINVRGESEGISPAETSSIIKVDINGNVTTDINTAVATPQAPSLGYTPPEIVNQLFSGPGTGKIKIEVLDPDSVKSDHIYRLEFIETSKYHNQAHPFYSIIDYSANDTLVKNAKILDVVQETKLFDGLSITISSDTAATIDYENSDWIKGNSNYIVQVGFDSRFAPAYKFKKIDYPADFEIRFTAPGEGDLSFPATSFSKPIQSNIIIKNLTENIDHFQFIFRDENNDELFNENDAIFIVMGDSSGMPAESISNLHVSWSISLFQDSVFTDSEQMAPQAGDIYHLLTKKPFRNNEYFEFTSIAQSLETENIKSKLDEIIVVPNPYTGAASWEPNKIDIGRGDRKIYFFHLPSICTIRIFSLAGKHIKTIEHHSGLLDGSESWNLVSKDGMDIAFGIYVFHVDAPGIGEKIGKFAVIK